MAKLEVSEAEQIARRYFCSTCKAKKGHPCHSLTTWMDLGYSHRSRYMEAATAKALPFQQENPNVSLVPGPLTKTAPPGWYEHRYR